MGKSSANARRAKVRHILKCLGIPLIQVVCLFLAASCTVGPDFHKPEAGAPAAWRGVDAPAASPTSVAVPREIAAAEWWKSFNDPVLDSLVEKAIGASLDVRLAQSRIRQARAARGMAAAGLWPEIDASAAYTYSRDSSYWSEASGKWISGYTGDLFQIGLDSSWELDFFGGTRRNVEAADADLQAAVEDRRDVLVTLLGELGTNYMNLRGFQQQIEIARRNLKSQRKSVEITREKHLAGLVSALDLANASAQVALTESQIPALESSARAAIYSLGVLLALEPGTLVPELTADAPIPPVPPEVPVGLPSELLRRRPDIRRSEARIHAATARIGVATADLFPRFSLTGSFGFSSINANTLGNWSSSIWSAGPAVSWPVFDAGRIRWNIEAKNAQEEQALLTYRKTVLTALRDVETAMFAYAREQDRRKALTEEVAHNRKAFDLSMNLYIIGRGDFLNVLIAERALYTSEDALVQSVRNLSGNLIALYKALGGGWETHP